MNKKLIALALVLLLAVGGLFAAYSVDVPADVTALLKANIGEYLNHGFTVGAAKFQSTVTITDAFTTNPSFTYGYETNAQGTINFEMTVGNFIHTNGTTNILILAVKKGSDNMTPTGGKYLLFDTITNAKSTGLAKNSAEATFTIVPAKKANVNSFDHLNTTKIAMTEGLANYADEADSVAGSYTSEVSIHISID